MSKIEEMLVQLMGSAGNLVESAIDWANIKKPVKTKKTGIEDEEGQDFSELDWRERYIENLLSYSERQNLLNFIPDLKDKSCLHLTPGRSTYIQDLRQRRHANNCIELNVERTIKKVSKKNNETQSKHLNIKGSIESLPFKNNAFDFILYPSALAWRADFPDLVPELARCLKSQGQLVCSMVHPFFEYLMFPRGGFSKKLSQLYSTLLQYGFFVEKFNEATLNDAVRHVSLPKEFAKSLGRYGDLPVIIVLRCLLVRKRRKA
ncbi:MAG: methyltransferase domain-containing protein [Deltaproteobacteria bacterium]|nr:methyltransferase domain-containing protein [Deltaproteobacteria bacterium]